MAHFLCFAVHGCVSVVCVYDMSVFSGRFSSAECRWFVKRPCGGKQRLKTLASEGLAGLQKHSEALSKMSPLDWRPSVVEKVLAKKMPIIGVGQKYHRGHHVRSVHVLGRLLARRAGMSSAAIAQTTAWQRADWDCEVRLLPGTASKSRRPADART